MKTNEVEIKIEKTVINWVRNDRFFDGLRKTPARIILAVFTYAALFGVGYVAFDWNGQMELIFYPLATAFVVLLQKLSVRFAFDDDSVIDEYQHLRRNRAYRRAYKRSALILSVSVLVFGLVVPVSSGKFDPGLPTICTSLTIWQMGVLVEFVWLLFVCQKYVSWGFKGEPFRSKDVPNE